MASVTPSSSTVNSDSKRFEFFLVSLPGLEDLLLREIQAWFPKVETATLYGGITVHASLAEGLAMNLALKIPTRILLRVDRFRARDFPKLFRKVSEFDWDQWIDLGCTVEVVAATKQSRLKIKSRIEETCLDAWVVLQQAAGFKADPKKPARIFVRIIEDLVTLSLDTSGERLHKRGTRQHIGEAPLRETIAAAMIQMTGESVESSATVEVVDPMMGSGTFLLEAASRDELVNAREFGFHCFAVSDVGTPTLSASRPKIVKLTGFERDRKTLKAARTNLADLKTTLPLKVIEEDFFKAKPLPPCESGMRWVLVNPPYGERLKVKGSLIEYYADLFAQCERVARPDRACFLLPAKAVKGKLPLPPHWKVLEKRRFLNGGIPVVAFLFGRTT